MDLYYAFLSCGANDGEIDDELKDLITAASKQGSAPRDALHTMLEAEWYKNTRKILKEYIDSLLDRIVNEKLNYKPSTTNKHGFEEYAKWYHSQLGVK